MEIREYIKYNEEEILRLYTAVGWTAYTENTPVLQEGFKNSMLVLAAYEGEELLGIIRTVGDGVTIVFVQDILVFPDKQRQGIGTALLKAILNRYPKVRQIELASSIIRSAKPSVRWKRLISGCKNTIMIREKCVCTQ